MTTREKILEATIQTLREAGTAGLSARSVAGRAGVNQALVFYHFGTMADLVKEATRSSVDATVASYQQRLAEARSLGELLAVGRLLHVEASEQGNVAEMAQLMAGAQHDAALAEAAAYAMSRWTAEVEAVLRRIIAGSALDGTVDPAGLARAISAAFIGLELYVGVDAEGGAAALEALEQLGALVEVIDDLGPVATRALRARLRRRSATTSPGKVGQPPG